VRHARRMAGSLRLGKHGLRRRESVCARRTRPPQGIGMTVAKLDPETWYTGSASSSEGEHAWGGTWGREKAIVMRNKLASPCDGAKFVPVNFL
jgi:hypothetical protein